MASFSDASTEATFAIGASASDLLGLEDLSFLHAIIRRYPEANFLAGPAEASPEGNPKLKDSALAYKVFEPSQVHPEAIEADRTFLGLLLLKACLNGNHAYFPNLSQESFDKLKVFTQRIIKTDSDLEFALYSLACNDLGKTQKLVDENVGLMGRKADDHDQLLAELVANKSDLFPGLQRLSAEQREMYAGGLTANLNLAQYVQGENLPENLKAIQNISPDARNLRLIAEIYDFSGATGHVRHDSSMLMNEDNLFAYLTAADELMKDPRDQAYQRYINIRAERVGIAADTAQGFALGRIAAMARTFTPEGGEAIKRVWENLPCKAREILAEELSVSGSDGKTGLLIYYAPAVIANAVKTAKDFERGLRLSLLSFAQKYEEARQSVVSASPAIVTVNVADVAKQAATDPERIAPALLPTCSFSDVLSGDRLAFVGIGGGSDCVQAAMIAKLSGKDACVISIRAETTGSQGASGKIGEKRTVENHGGEVSEGVYRVTPETTGSGRFLEAIPVELGLPTYLVIDRQDGSLSDHISSALRDFSGVQTVYAIDTGGDSLYRTSVSDQTKATPDQDLASLSALAELGLSSVYSVIVAPGVDSPPYADDVLLAAAANQVTFSSEETAAILKTYEDCHMDGSDVKRFGKTALAWQAALRGEMGLVKLAIPERFVSDPVNPWNPNVRITPDMASALVMPIGKHLSAIGVTVSARPRSFDVAASLGNISPK